ncbi:hypothetical protein POM88_051326 [Heracleum sosnowskyi]|uniref:Uncharacterized protein n=1 Tax=Heracleum sosnowskyi TaxID=360622 RepID=A0AAD8GZ70_9APIA|nr:hypothetical protein POM88_051326 [Heracleum sosnowskyi]
MIILPRFEEREEVVKMDVFNTFIELLRQTRNATNGQNESHGSRYPCCPSQLNKGVVKDLSAAFFTFQTLSSYFQDSGVEQAHDRDRIGGSKAVMIKKGKKSGASKNASSTI